MRVLLGSGGFRTPERIATLGAAMRELFGDAPRLVFVPYAIGNPDAMVQLLTDRGIHAGYQLDSLHRHADPAAALREAPGVFVGGGNTFRLLTTLYRLGLLDVLRQRVREGMPYLGVSAGSNVACPTIMTTNDMPIVQPPSFAALELVPFQVNPHYYSGSNYVRTDDGLQPHFGETRDERIAEFHELNDIPVVGLWEGGLLRVDGDRVHLSAAPARVFRKGRPPVDVAPDADLSDLLKEQAS